LDQLQAQYNNLKSAHLVPVIRQTENNLPAHVKKDIEWQTNKYHRPRNYIYRHSRNTYEPVEFLNNYWHFLQVYTGQPHTASGFHIEPYARGTGYWYIYNYQHPKYQHYTCNLFKNIAVDSIYEYTHYQFKDRLATANEEAEEQYLHIPRPIPKPPVLVIETEEVSTLAGDLTISLYITTQATHSLQFTEPHTHEETTSIDKPLPEQDDIARPDGPLSHKGPRGLQRRK
jgi:hypothetical protein